MYRAVVAKLLKCRGGKAVIHAFDLLKNHDVGDGLLQPRRRGFEPYFD